MSLTRLRILIFFCTSSQIFKETNFLRFFKKELKKHPGESAVDHNFCDSKPFGPKLDFFIQMVYSKEGSFLYIIFEGQVIENDFKDLFQVLGLRFGTDSRKELIQKSRSKCFPCFPEVQKRTIYRSTLFKANRQLTPR